MNKISKRRILMLIRLRRSLYTTKRKEKYRLRKAGQQRHNLNMKRHAELSGHYYNKKNKKILPPKPEFSENIKFLASLPNLFSLATYNKKDNGHLFIPECFSLIENYEESFDFLKKLYTILYRGYCKTLTLDYANCKRIDVDASICMDIILAEFISYLNQCHTRGYRDLQPQTIQPINYSREDIMKVLFSIGAYKNIKGLEIKFQDIEALPVLINHQKFPDRWQRSEIDLTKIVEYIKLCLKRLNRELTTDAETEFYKVIGEIMSNAEEHSSMPQRFAIGFFQETHNTDEHYGVFNFSIFNFGDTIYDTFKTPDCANKKVVAQMGALSEDYTKKGWFRKAEFEEETLWTLYSLQEGVTSKEKKRGNGSIQYIENFFKLKGDLNKDDTSKLVILSGNTRILFDGTYKTIIKPGEKRKHKMVTFNTANDITEKPDKNFVTFAPHYFPGTLISARILIKFDNTN